MKCSFFQFSVWRLGVIAQEREAVYEGNISFRYISLQVARQLNVPATQGVFVACAQSVFHSALCFMIN